jgi:hypothetical protein
MEDVIAEFVVGPADFVVVFVLNETNSAMLVNVLIIFVARGSTAYE